MVLGLNLIMSCCEVDVLIIVVGEGRGGPVREDGRRQPPAAAPPPQPLPIRRDTTTRQEILFTEASNSKSKGRNTDAIYV
jgi:hypothetical protein